MNLVPCCPPCNRSKNNRTPEEWAAGVFVRVIRNPRLAQANTSRPIRFREVDERRVEFIQRKKGIGNITDAVRFALAETAGDLGFEEDKEDGAKDEAPQERDKQR